MTLVIGKRVSPHNYLCGMSLDVYTDVRRLKHNAISRHVHTHHELGLHVSRRERWQPLMVCLFIVGISCRLRRSSYQSLSLHPFSDDCVDLLRLLPEQPVRSIDVLGCVVRNIVSHLDRNLICYNGIAEGSDPQRRAFDLDTVLDCQQRLVSLPVGLSVTVVIAWDVLACNPNTKIRGPSGVDESLQGPRRPFLEYSST